MKKTLVIGAKVQSVNFFYNALQTLVKYKHEVHVLGLDAAIFEGLCLHKIDEYIPDLDTVSLYLNASEQKKYYTYIEALKPKRVIFNPGAENYDFKNRLVAKGIVVEEACTLFLLYTNKY